MNKTVGLTERQKLAEKVDKMSMALILLITALRDNIKVSEEGSAIASVPVEVLDSVENIIIS